MTQLNASTRLSAAAPNDQHLEKILNAINHSGIKSVNISSEGQELVISTMKPFNVHMLQKFAEQMHVHVEHISIELGHGVIELRIPAFVVGQ